MQTPGSRTDWCGTWCQRCWCSQTLGRTNTWAAMPCHPSWRHKEKKLYQTRLSFTTILETYKSAITTTTTNRSLTTLMSHSREIDHLIHSLTQLEKFRKQNLFRDHNPSNTRPQIWRPLRFQLHAMSGRRFKFSHHQKSVAPRDPHTDVRIGDKEKYSTQSSNDSMRQGLVRFHTCGGYFYRCLVYFPQNLQK